MSEAQREMPKYKCHKEVWALKIKDVKKTGLTPDTLPATTTIVPEDEGYAAFLVSEDYANKHNPKPGGYYVVYKDGYKSYSPADAFESGYARA